MSIRRRAFRTLATLGALALAAPIAFYANAIWWTTSAYHYGLSDMDWNRDGHVSFAEVLASADIGARLQGECREFFSLKDGATVRVDCP